ncbi:hypothetical protein OIV83_005079 [Microbotryomycetes sp. JL201]|nr:hypothetical protein OIV83_005079 [Microbotryomycetes sp. JL201]
MVGSETRTRRFANTAITILQKQSDKDRALEWRKVLFRAQEAGTEERRVFTTFFKQGAVGFFSTFKVDFSVRGYVLEMLDEPDFRVALDRLTQFVLDGIQHEQAFLEAFRNKRAEDPHSPRLRLAIFRLALHNLRKPFLKRDADVASDSEAVKSSAEEADCNSDPTHEAGTGIKMREHRACQFIVNSLKSHPNALRARLVLVLKAVQQEDSDACRILKTAIPPEKWQAFLKSFVFPIVAEDPSLCTVTILDQELYDACMREFIQVASVVLFERLGWPRQAEPGQHKSLSRYILDAVQADVNDKAILILFDYIRMTYTTKKLARVALARSLFEQIRTLPILQSVALPNTCHTVKDILKDESREFFESLRGSLWLGLVAYNIFGKWKLLILDDEVQRETGKIRDDAHKEREIFDCLVRLCKNMQSCKMSDVREGVSRLQTDSGNDHPGSRTGLKQLFGLGKSGDPFYEQRPDAKVKLILLAYLYAIGFGHVAELKQSLGATVNFNFSLHKIKISFDSHFLTDLGAAPATSMSKRQGRIYGPRVARQFAARWS